MRYVAKMEYTDSMRIREDHVYKLGNGHRDPADRGLTWLGISRILEKNSQGSQFERGGMGFIV